MNHPAAPLLPLRDGARGTPGRPIKVDHSGEFGAVNIYRAQILVAAAVTSHLVEQMETVRAAGDDEAHDAIGSIVQEELEHMDHGVAHGRDGVLYRPLGVVVSAATPLAIWLGMVL